MKTKKAQSGNFLMLLPFVFALLLITVGIGTGVYMFYGKDYDVRAIDAQLLAVQIKNCLAQNEINLSQQDEFYKTCNLNKKVLEENYYIKISENENVLFRLKNTDLCALSDKNEEYPKCVNETFQDNNGKELEVLAGSAQKIQRELS